jgi:RNA methyltransferase, TrmH family
MIAIASAGNPHFRGWLRLSTQVRARRAQRRTLAEGLHLAQAAIDAGVTVHAWIVRRGAHEAGSEAAGIVARLQRLAVPGYELAAPLYERIAPVERGAGLMLVVASAADLLPVAAREDLVFLDGIQDPGNVGTLLRVAAAAGIGHVLGGEGCADFWSPKVVRAGMGAQFRLRTTEGVTAAELARALDGPWIACEAHEAESLWRAQVPSGACGWIFGAEGRGISAEAVAVCPLRVRIPIAPGVESLNVAAAAAVCLFERRRIADLREVPDAKMGDDP